MSETFETRVLLALRLTGFADSDRLADRSGVDLDVVVAVLERAASAGWVQRREGRTRGWTLSAEGRRRGEDLLAAEHRAAGVSARLAEHYEAFLPLNARLHAVCTRWQVRAGSGDAAPVPNSHDDPDYDAAVVGELVELHESARPLLGELGRTLERFAGYGDRLALACERVLAGDPDWFTRPMIDSYHTVWFELHEDLLASLGRDRRGER